MKKKKMFLVPFPSELAVHVICVDPDLERSCEFNSPNQIKTLGTSLSSKYLRYGFRNCALIFEIASVWLTCLVSEEIYCEDLKRPVRVVR